MILLTSSDKEPREGRRPELELLLCAARTYMDPARADRIKVLLNGDIDWEYLMNLAHRHGLGSLLYWQLNATCPELVPPGYLGQLRDHFHANTRRNLYLTGEMLRVIDLLQRSGITAIPYKGPVLSAACYGHLGFREFGDLDLLVPEIDAPRAEALLYNEGYRPLCDLSSAQRAVLYKYSHHMHLQRASDDTHLEIHWRTTPRFLLKGSGSKPPWGRLEEVSIGGRDVSTFSAEDLLIILCVHEAIHLWGRLEWICDTAELIRSREDLDWDLVIRRAGAFRCKRLLFIGLLLAHDLLGTDLPEELLKSITDDPSSRVIADQVRRRISEDGSLSPLFLIKTTDRMRDRVGLVARIARTSITPTLAEWQMLSLPPAFSFLYWAIRPVRLVGKYLLLPLKDRIASTLK